MSDSGDDTPGGGSGSPFRFGQSFGSGDPEPRNQESSERGRRANRWDTAGLPRPDVGLIVRRIAAWMLDQLLVSGLASLVGLAAGSLGQPGVGIDPGFAMWVRAFEVVYRWAMQSAVGYTLGKRLLGLRLVSMGSERPASLPVLGREIALFVILGLPTFVPGLPEQHQFTVITLLLFLSLWVVFRRRDHRAIHDLPFHTRVVRADSVEEVAPGDGPVGPA